MSKPMSNQSDRIDALLEGVANEYSAGAFYANAEPLLVHVAQAAVEQLIVDEYKRGYTKGVIDNSINKDKLIVEAKLETLENLKAGAYKMGGPDFDEFVYVREIDKRIAELRKEVK